MRRHAAVALVTLALVTLALGACGNGGPGGDEQAVCDAVQGLVDDVAAGKGPAARQRVDELRTAVDGTSDEGLALQGGRFFRTLDQPVGPWDNMTLQQINAIGREATSETAGALQGMIVACSKLGVDIVRLPQAPRSG